MLRVALILGILAAAPSASGQEARPPADPASGADTTVQAQDVTRANRLLGTLMSPFCPGLTLANCPSPYAETLRVSIRTRLDAGEPPDSIVESLVAAFGEGIRGAPPARGMGLALWVLPLAVVATGGLALVWWLRHRSVRNAVAPNDRPGGPPGELTPDDRARLEAERQLLE
jgi:cytochrome c-type biogenesis protein CcmH/NrfF